ncbi:MAG TPA: alanine--glyoxylate aminotransferase family protein [Methylophilaceae bacterium]|nr:alanine--glyoxylate aminotransferase family protein [Methylophilaceae bacterium]HQR59777.1 alanine--glyoxylate aminotransferase family protein [Methylophilaceae bacterium]
MSQAPRISSFQPPNRILLGPGPSDVHQRVLNAMARPTVGHLDPCFSDMMDEMKTLLRYAFQTENALTFPISAPGSVGMESCFVNLVEPGDKVIVCANGVFGRRMAENVRRTRGELVLVEDAWGKPVDPQKVEDAFKAHPETRILAFVHAETSTGVESDARLLTEIAHRHGALVIVDAVTSLGCVPLLVDEWGIDAIYSGSQKGLSCTPGLSPASFGERVIEKLKARRVPVQSWFMDLNLVLGYWAEAKRTYHHTAPINALYGLHEALVMLAEEGLQASWARHRRNHLALLAGLQALGLELLVEEKARLPQLNAVVVPQGLSEPQVRADMLNLHGIEIGAGLGDLAGKIFRIGLMGNSSTPANVRVCLTALESVLAAQHWQVVPGRALAAAEQVWA